MTTLTELTFTVPKSWWVSANDRTHWAAKARATRNLRHLAATSTRGLDTLGTTHVAAFIGYLTGGRADPSNAAPTVKALIDGMTDAGVWPDDDSTHVIGPTFLRDPKSPTPGHYTVRLLLTPQEVPW
jgi:crossover junction endodeoxyribonuclease RusA